MNIKQTKLDGVVVLEPNAFNDSRGFVKEIFRHDAFKKIGITTAFLQSNIAYSGKNVLRGLHHQEKNPQGKLVYCTQGAVFDVAVDLRKKSPTFGEHVSVLLTQHNHRQIWIPPGFAHGFCVLSDFSLVNYYFTEYFCADDQVGILWSDVDLGIDWPIDHPVLSEKDANLPSFKDFTNK